MRKIKQHLAERNGVKSKLFLFEGIPGTGKSTLAHFFYCQMLRNGIDIRYFHEEEYNHPLFYSPANIQCIRSQKSVTDFISCWPDQWMALFPFAKRFDVLLLTSYLFEDGVRVLFNNNVPEEVMLSFINDVLSMMKPLDPVIVFFKTRFPMQTIEWLWSKRGTSWMRYFYSVDEMTPFAGFNNVKGIISSILLWSEFQKLCLRILERIEIKKLIIDISGEDFLGAGRTILDYCECRFVADKKIFFENPEMYCGLFLSESTKETSCAIRYDGSSFRADFLWPDLKLIPVTEKRFWIQSFPLQVIFSGFDNGKYMHFMLDGTRIYDYTGLKFRRISI